MKDPCIDHMLSALGQFRLKLLLKSAYCKRAYSDFEWRLKFKGQSNIRPRKIFLSICYLSLALFDSYLTYTELLIYGGITHLKKSLKLTGYYLIIKDKKI